MTPPADHRPFLRAVCAAPDDDLPRLVYADWLDETGDPADAARAAFIRGQIAHGPSDPLTQEPYRKYVTTWAGHWPDWMGWRLPKVRWRRGFPHHVDASSGLLRKYATQPLDVPIDSLETDLPAADGAALRGLLSLPIFSMVRTLRPSIATFRANFEPLFAVFESSSHLRSLTALDFNQHDFDDAFLVEFLTRLNLNGGRPPLTSLSLARCMHITDAGANFLATARSLDRLAALNVTGVPLSAASLRMLRRRFGDGLIA